MSVDPNIDYSSHDPHDGDELSDDPRVREAQLLERKMRAALATKENPLSDGESTSERLKAASRRVEGRDAEAGPETPAGSAED